MSLLSRAEKKANRRAADALMRRKKQEQVEEKKAFEQDKQSILSENKRTVRDLYDNASALYKRRKHTRRNLIYGVVALLLVSFGVLALSFLMFRVENVKVSGNLKYNENELLDTIGLKGGENLLLLNTENIEKRLYETYPYIEEIKVKRSFPSSVSFTVSEADAAYAVPVEDGQYALVSAKKKVLELTDTLPDTELCVVAGAYANQPVPGKQLSFADEVNGEQFDMIVSALDSLSIGRVTGMDLSDASNLTLRIEERLNVYLGTVGSLDYKLKFVRELITNEIDPNQHGDVDVRNAATRKAIFKPAASVSSETSEEPEETIQTTPNVTAFYDEGDYDIRSETPYR